MKTITRDTKIQIENLTTGVISKGLLVVPTNHIIWTNKHHLVNILSNEEDLYGGNAFSRRTNRSDNYTQDYFISRSKLVTNPFRVEDCKITILPKKDKLYNKL